MIWIKADPSDLSSNCGHGGEIPGSSEFGGGIMIPEDPKSVDKNDDSARIPLMQQLLDNPFLLLFLGVLIPMAVYIVWGVIDILTIPVAP